MSNPYGHNRSVLQMAIAQRLADGMTLGASLAQIARRRGMPSVHTLYAWKRTRPDFAEALAYARDAREDWLEDQIQVIAEEATPATFPAARAEITALKKRSAYLRKKAEQEGTQDEDA